MRLNEWSATRRVLALDLRDLCLAITIQSQWPSEHTAVADRVLSAVGTIILEEIAIGIGLTPISRRCAEDAGVAAHR